MILTAPDDRSFPNGPSYQKGDEVDTAELAAALGRDVAELGADLLEQGWPKAKTRKKPKTDPAPAGDETAPDGADTKES